MKKRFLLAVLPALLVLSACQAGPKSKNNDIFLEDTLAHDEIFGAEKLENRALMPRKLGDDPVIHPDNDPSIGVQSKVEDGKVSFRFVAAVTFSESNLAPTNAVWTRTVSDPDGQTYPKDTGSFECTTAYTKLSNGGSPYSIDDFNNAQTPITSYTHFVVYTLRNIPLSTYGDNYVCAYLNLSGEGGLNQRTKAVVISVDQSIKYTHDAALGVSFITGTFGGNPGVINATSIRTSESDQNKATFEDLRLSKGDSFVINEFYLTKLYVKSVPQFSGDSSYFFANDNGKMKANFAGKYNLYLNKSDEIHTTGSELVRPIYVDTSSVSWWGENRVAALWAFGGSESSQWIGLSRIGTSNMFVTADPIDPSEFKNFLVVDMIAGETEPSWDDGKVNNQTVNSSNIPTTGKTDCIKIANEKDGSNWKISWVVR